MNELDDMLDELTQRVYVVVTFDQFDAINITSISEKMTFDDAMDYWGKSGSSFDHVAHFQTPKKPIVPTAIRYQANDKY